LVTEIASRLGRNQRVRRSLPIWGRVHVDRQLPFLCVYRRPNGRADAETERLVTSEASYLLASTDPDQRDGLRSLVRAIVTALCPRFGVVLLLEIWSAEPVDDPVGEPHSSLTPAFRIFASRGDGLGSTIETLERSLSSITIQRQRAQVDVRLGRRAAPPGLDTILPRTRRQNIEYHTIGLEVAPIYRNAAADETYPMVMRSLRHQLSRALRQTFYQFAQSQTKQIPLHYQTLGRRAMVKAVWEVDHQLAAVSNAFDFLLALTPINPDQAWIEFSRRGFERAPDFVYRPIEVEPHLLKRMLFNIPVERVEDPVLSQLFIEKQEELDRQITLLGDRHRSQFLHGSLQVFGGVDNDMLSLANTLLASLAAGPREDRAAGAIKAAAFARRARREVAHYRRAYPDLATRVQVRGDVVGLLVSRGNLLIGRTISVPSSRVDALIQHEIGTHVVTWVNGRAQPFRQLASGLAGYEELQEGLAVLAEYLVGGLDRARVRLLAARVVAVRRLTEGASFVEVFRELHDEHGFDARTAFAITTRVFRGGGLTKDAIYLIGLVKLLTYLEKGGLVDRLFVGKINLDHVKLIEDLEWREVLRPPVLRPRYLDLPETAERLKRLRAGMSVVDLVEGEQT
jgi:uncharacterized protein (TIGR02421 family)